MRRGRIWRRLEGAGCCLLIPVFLSISASAFAQDRHQRILLLYDEDRTLPGLAILDRSLRSSFTAGIGTDIEFFTESMNLSQFNDGQYELVLREHYARKYRNRQPDLVVAVMGPALGFLVRHGDATFPGVPIVFCGADAADIQGLTVPPRVTGLLVHRVFAPTLDVVLRLQPDTRHVVVVGGTSPFDQHLLAQARRDFQRFESRLSFEYLTELSLGDLELAVSRLKAQSVVLFVTLFRDGAGRAHIPHDAVSRLADAAIAPVYIFVDQYLGRGPVGGHLYSLERHGNSAADLGVRVLNGEPPASIPVREARSTANMFDARQLSRWRLDENRLPPGSIVRFRETSLWRDYRREVLIVLGALILQSLLIVGLLYQRRARQRAEVESRRNLAIAADANRRVTMSALTGSIAHELSQPLSSILFNAQAGESLLASDRATPETLREILADIRSDDVRATQIIERHRAMLRTHQLDTRPIDIHAVVRESVALVDHERSARQIHVDVDLPSDPCVVVGDQVLLQQVLVNLLINAMEAMTGTSREPRQVTVRNVVGQDRVEVSVTDAGTGLPEKAEGRLFSPFVTTKPHGIGIGLTIARSIVEAHRGKLEAHNNPEGGATFSVILPRRGATSGSAISPPLA
jgi:signal transduction histidine kinase